MTPTVPVTNEVPKAEKITVKRTLFNLDTFARESKEKEIDAPKKVVSTDEMLAAVDNDQDRQA